MSQKHNSRSQHFQFYFVIPAIVAMVVAFAVVGITHAQDAVDANQVKDHERTITDNERQYKNLLSETERLNKQLSKQASVTSDVTASIISARQHIDEGIACNNSLRTKIGTSDFWDQNTCYSDHIRAAEDLLNDVLRPAEDFYNRKKNIENRRREVRSNIQRDLKEFERGKIDYSEALTIKNKIDAEFSKADAATSPSSGNVDTIHDVDNALNTLFQDYYAVAQEIRDQGNQKQKSDQISKDIKNYESQCKQMMREFGRFEKDILRMTKNESTIANVAQVKSTYSTLCSEAGAITKMRSAVQSKDADLFDDARVDFDSYQKQFWESMDDTRRAEQEKYQKEETIRTVERNASQMLKNLAQMKKEHQKLEKRIATFSKKYLDTSDRKEIQDAMKTQLAQFNELLAVREAEINSYRSSAETDPDSVDFEGTDGGDFWETAEPLLQKTRTMGEAVKELARIEKDMKKQLKPVYELKKRESLPEETIADLDSILAKVNGIMQQAWKEVTIDPENVRNILSELEGIGEEFDEVLETIE